MGRLDVPICYYEITGAEDHTLPKMPDAGMHCVTSIVQMASLLGKPDQNATARGRNCAFLG